MEIKVQEGYVKSSAVGPEDPLVGIKGSMAWQNAWMMAIALAWSDETLKKQLVSDPRAFFETQCNFKLPGGLIVRINDMPSKDPVGNPTGWDAASKMWYLKDSEVIMYLPPPPPLDAQAVALSAYLATGRTYPFTVC